MDKCKLADLALEGPSMERSFKVEEFLAVDAAGLTVLICGLGLDGRLDASSLARCFTARSAA